jgi:FlaA1/EpsC-like NDP-sugar epimerase
MITLSGLRPDVDIDIKFTGVRPGEKLFEELRKEGEDIEPTVHPKIRIWKSTKTNWDDVQKTMAQMAQLVNCTDRDAIVNALRQAIPEYEPLNPPKPEHPAPTKQPASVV